MYNDDAVLDKSTNTVIFNIFSEYSDYKLWAKANPKLDKEAQADKESRLKWNEGAGIETEQQNSDSTSISNEKEYFHPDGSFNKIGRYYAKYSDECSIPGSTVREGDEHIHLFFSRWEDFIGETYFRKDSSGVFYTYQIDKIGKRVEKHITGGRKLEERVFYDEDLTNVLYLKTFNEDNSVEFAEYYLNNKVRTKGNLDEKGLMQDDWETFHHNGLTSAYHTFKDGKLIDVSLLFFENGNLSTRIYHD